MTFLRHLGRSVRLKTFLQTAKHVKCCWVLSLFCLGFFVAKRSLWTLFLGPFSRAKTTYKFIWKNVLIWSFQTLPIWFPKDVGEGRMGGVGGGRYIVYPSNQSDSVKSIYSFSVSKNAFFSSDSTSVTKETGIIATA